MLDVPLRRGTAINFNVHYISSGQNSSEVTSINYCLHVALIQSKHDDGFVLSGVKLSIIRVFHGQFSTAHSRVPRMSRELSKQFATSLTSSIFWCAFIYQETYGEDPYLSGSMATEFVRGLQGDHPRYIRTSAGCKHFAVHGGPENIPSSKYTFNAKVTRIIA
jgi:Glycosyl hydrolase family 3 N terminal domain